MTKQEIAFRRVAGRAETASPDGYDRNIVKGAYKAAMAWSKRHPNPLAPRPLSKRLPQ